MNKKSHQMVIVQAKCTRHSCQVVLQVKRFFFRKSLEKKLTNYFLSNQADLFVIDTTAAAASSAKQKKI